MVSSNSAWTSTCSILRVKRPSCIFEKSSSSSTMLVSRRDSFRMMPTPRLSCLGSLSPSSVSPQPLMAVRGVRSSWETEEINSDLIFSLLLIWEDMLLIASMSWPISSR